MTQIKRYFRFIAGIIVGVVGSGMIAGWLFAIFEWLNVEMDPTKNSLGPAAWGAMLATWAASSFAGQMAAANAAHMPAIIWFIAACDAAMLLFIHSFVPHPVFVAGAGIVFIVAFRLKDSDLLRISAPNTPNR